jgi:hypothetical protein
MINPKVQRHGDVALLTFVTDRATTAEDIQQTLACDARG